MAPCHGMPSSHIRGEFFGGDRADRGGVFGIGCRIEAVKVGKDQEGNRKTLHRGVEGQGWRKEETGKRGLTLPAADGQGNFENLNL